MVVQQHLGAGSTLAPLLKRRTGLSAEWALDRGSIRPGDVLVCPPQHSIELLASGCYRLRPAAGRARSLVHDALFASLADAYGGRGVAVVLTPALSRQDRRPRDRAGPWLRTRFLTG